MIVGIAGLMGTGKTTATSFFPKSWKRIRFQKPIKHPHFIIANTGSKNDLKKAIQKIVTVLEHSLL